MQICIKLWVSAERERAKGKKSVKLVDFLGCRKLVLKFVQHQQKNTTFSQDANGAKKQTW